MRHLAAVEEQPLIYKAEICLVVVLLHYLRVSYHLSLIPMLMKHFVFQDEDLRTCLPFFRDMDVGKVGPDPFLTYPGR